jgi:calpain-15
MSTSAPIKKEIHPGITLIRQNKFPNFMSFSIKNDTFTILSFTVDLTGSIGVSIQECEGLIRTVEINPQKTELVATAVTSGNWQIATKFRFTTKPPPKDQALKFISADSRQLEENIAFAKQHFRREVNYTSLSDKYIPDHLGHFIDPYFSPTHNAVYLGSHGAEMNTPCHWRRPKDFFRGDFELFQDIEPNDIKQGQLGDCWFMCALSSLAERPDLVRRLFITENAEKSGIYKVRFCKGGEWVNVVVDDYFPCFPNAGPIFSRSQGNELWVLLLEKAYAKLHGSYMLLRGGWANEGMMDLTGCPTAVYDFDDESTQKLIREDKLWDLLKTLDEDGALISASTAGVDRWTEVGGTTQKGGLVPGHAYTIIQVKQAYGNRLLNIRNPWGNFEWDGEWSDNSPLWTPKMIKALNPVLNDKDGTFWISWNDFVKNFNGVNICRASSFNEARVKGLFEKVKDHEFEYVSSKWKYMIECEESTVVYIGVHQDDERILGVDTRRPYIDLGIVVLEIQGNSARVIKYKEQVSDRQVEMEVELIRGKKYLILPITTGSALGRAPDAETTRFPLEQDGEFHPLFESTLKDIFRKANCYIGEDLSHTEFSTLLKLAGIAFSRSQFRELRKQVHSTKHGITKEGFIEFMREMLHKYGEATIRDWLNKWGYDEYLYSVHSRCFVLTLHSYHPLKVQMSLIGDSHVTQNAWGLLLERFAKVKGERHGARLGCIMHTTANAFTYGVLNENSYEVTAELDFSTSEGLVYSCEKRKSSRIIPANSWTVLSHCQISKASEACRIRPVFKILR